MRKRLILATSMAVLSLVTVAVLMFNGVTGVSAQQILDRASAAQAAEAATEGISHSVIEVYEGSQSFGGDHAGTKVVDESYFDPTTGNYRFITRDTTGKLLEVVAYDGSFNYSSFSAQPVVAENSSGPLTIHRTLPSQDEMKKGQLADPTLTANSLFEHFRSNPRVELLGKETRADGRQVYILINRNSQTEKLADGQSKQTITGTMKMVFDAQTYQLLESETTVYEDGKEVVVEKVRFLVDEVLPAETQVDWNLNDLQGVTFVDDPREEKLAEEVSFEVISAEQLAAHANLASHAYVLKTIPAGFTQEITAVANQPQDQPYAYEIHYRNLADEYFGLQAIGVNEASFIATAFYDGSYKSATGLVLNYSSSRPENSTEGTSAILTVPEGTSFLLGSTLSREQVQALVEELVPLK